MISQRLRGLVNLHAILATLVATLLFLIYAWASRQWMVGLDQVTLTPYVFCVLAGMAANARYLLLFASRFHRISWIDAARIATRQTGFVALFIFTLMFATKDRAVSRIFLGSYLALLWIVELFINVHLPRILCQMLFQRQHLAPTLFIGRAKQLGGLREWLETKKALGIEPVGFLTADGQPRDAGDTLSFLGPITHLERVIEQKRVAQVIVLEMPPTDLESRFIIEVCQNHGCRVLFYSNLADRLHHPLIPVIEGGHAFFTLQAEPLEDPGNRILKRTFDLVVSVPVVVFLLPPLCLLVWVMQRIQSPGRLLFKQTRAGHRSNEFTIFKFRSMNDTSPDAAAQAVQARKGDDRIYPFGRFMRKTSLDEFPQFFNVLRGEMSVVGPRPHLVAHDTEFMRHYRGYRTRHFAKPGLTGLAQTRGYRGEVSDPKLIQQRVQSDLQYIATWSIWLDIQLTLKTCRQVFFPPKAAY